MRDYTVFGSGAGLVASVADQIAHCDFRVTLSQYMTGGGRSWVITVGETTWQRHLVVQSVSPDGTDANLAILSPAQSAEFGDVNGADVTSCTTLKELIADKYRGVKKALQPSH